MKAIRSVTLPSAGAAGRREADAGAGKEAGHGKAKSPCGCGGGGSGGCECTCSCEEVCCQLECIERPRFFCGQLLTDQDLDALVGWTRRRLGLARYVDGWGVACGLDVTCHAGAPASVAVSPGYAVDCCGNAVVVCEPAVLDLSGACRDPENPCGDLHAWAGGKGGGEKKRRVLVDVGIRYHETHSDPQSALAQGPCGQVATCEFTRTREGHELFWSEAQEGASPVDAAARRWLEAWKCCCEVVERFEERFGRVLEGGGTVDEKRREEIRRRIEELKKRLETAGSREEQLKIHAEIRELEAELAGGPVPPRLAEAIRRWLLAWLDEHPLTQFCFLRDWICEASDERLLEPQRLVGLLFALVQDCRNALARCSCPPCSEHDGVPLARVCLEAGGEKGHCRVLTIDPYPPYRRPIATDCCPAPLGHVNVACVFWHRQHDACLRLAEAGLEVRLPAKPGEPPATFAELRKLCKQDPFAPCGEEICLEVIAPFDPLCLGPEPRVIGFRPCPPELPPPDRPEPKPVNADPRKSGPQEVQASDGAFRYALGFACVNPNPFPVTVHYVDRLPAELAYAQDDSGQQPAVSRDGTVHWRFEVPARDTVDRGWAMQVKFRPPSETITVINHAGVRVEAPDGTVIGGTESGPVQTVILFSGRPDRRSSPARYETETVDDLTRIKGIAAAREKELVDHGIDSYEKLAAADPAELTKIFPGVAERFLAQWRDEAKRLARGGSE